MRRALSFLQERRFQAGIAGEMKRQKGAKTMYKTITSATAEDFDQQLNAAENDGFTVISSYPCAYIFRAFVDEFGILRQTNFTALMHRPDAAPSPFMTANDFLAAMDASVEIMQSMADHADEVLREEARQYGGCR